MHDLEISILQHATELLKSHSKRLEACGITWRGPTISVWRSQPECYTSEIEVKILRGDEIEDVLEFHIYRDGQPVVTINEAVSWFEEQLEQLEIGRN